MTCNNAYIKSEGDLEIVTLYEIHSALANIVGPELYDVLGRAPEQNIQFKNQASFNLFVILVAELFAESDGKSTQISQASPKSSLFNSLVPLLLKYPDEVKECGLDNCYKELDEWIKREVEIEFWCGALNKQIRFPLTNYRLLWFGSNTVKHNLLRLSSVINKLHNLCNSIENNFSVQDAVAALEDFMTETQSRLLYHSSYLVEMLGKLFKSLNILVEQRFNNNPTNDVRKMALPEGLTADIFADFYGSTLVFKRYPIERITKYTPQTTKYLKMRYK